MPTGRFFVACLFAVPLFAASSGALSVIDPSGNVWTTGATPIPTLITTTNAFQKTIVPTVCGTENLSPFQGPSPVACAHGFLTKQDSGGLVRFSTYLGGSSQDGVTAITTDSQGNIYLAGYTYSVDFPVTAGVAQSTNAGPTKPTVVPYSQGPYGPAYVFPGGDAFVAKFAPDGTLLFSTLLGGSGQDVPSLIGVDAAGSIYVSGSTTSSDFPLTAGALTSHPAATFFTRLNSSGTAITYSTYSTNSILAFDVDGSGVAYLTGYGNGAYVSSVQTSGAGLLHTTQISDIAPKVVGAGTAIAISGGNLFLTVSPAPLPPSQFVPLPPDRPLGASYFLELPSDGSKVLSETDLSNTQFDSLLLDSAGDVYAFGHGTGAIPAAPNQLLAAPCGEDGGSFVLEFDSNAKLLHATYFRQGTDAAVALTAPGRLQVFRSTAPMVVALDLATAPTASFGCPMNLASAKAGPGVAPGEILLLTGSGLGPAQGVSATPDSSGQYPTMLGGVQVIVGTKPAPLLYVQDGEIHAVAPFALPETLPIQVLYANHSAALDSQLNQWDPGIFSVNGHGAIVNQDGTANTPANPASLGSIVSVYCTGTGYYQTTVTDGETVPIPPPYIITELAYPELLFNGMAGATLWAGAAPGIIAGVTQINVRLPASLPPGTSLLAVPVILDTAGSLSPPVTISVK